MNRRVLVVGHPYPDHNMGSVRLRRICRLLPRHGWDPVVLTHAGGAALAANPPPGVRIEPVAAPDLTQIYQSVRSSFRRTPPPSATPAGAGGTTTPAVQNIGLTSKINRWLMIPDKQRPWLKPVIRRGRELLRQEKYEVIFATLDPRTALIAASRLSKHANIPAVLEYRDLWIGNPYYHLTQPTALHRAWHARLEREAIRQAAQVSAVCEGIQEYLNSAYAGLLRAPVALNYNFFDPDEYPPRSPRTGTEPFVVSHTGNLYASRTPHQFFEGMQRFIQRLQLTPAQFRFRWAGGLSGIHGLDEVLDRTGVRPFIDFLGQIPHRSALQLLVDSDVSLLLQAPDDTIHIPGKLFEAMGARVPILALANPCETARLIERCQAGLVSVYSTETVADTLVEFHQRWRRQERWSFDESAVNAFSADAAVGRLARLFDNAAASTPRKP